MDVQKACARLVPIRTLTFEARSRAISNTGWNGSATGTVRVEVVETGTILFHERGVWSPEVGTRTTFSNVFRWTADPDGGFIRLEHLRFGPDQPVHLFDLVPVVNSGLESSEPHVCREDRYAARMEFDEIDVRLMWTINGPKKAETIVYTYT